MTDNTAFPARLREVLNRTWRPLPGSVAADIAINHSEGRCGSRTLRDLRRMVRTGSRLEGWWWISQLDAPTGSLTRQDLDWILYCWAEIGAGRQPFRCPRSAS